MRRILLIVVGSVLTVVIAAAPAQGQDDPATCLSLVDFELHAGDDRRHAGRRRAARHRRSGRDRRASAATTGSPASAATT